MGFALPSANVAGLRSHLDLYARERLTLADFEPSLRYDAELGLDQVTPEFFQALSALEPFGMGNPEPVFVAHGVRLLAPPKMIKDKHVKLRVAAASNNGQAGASGWRKAISFDALGWHLGERAQASQLLPGDHLAIAFSLDHNDHPEYGGLELSLRDFQSQETAEAASAGQSGKS